MNHDLTPRQIIHIEAVKAANAAGTEALKASILVNGGAAVAILAFASHASSAAVKEFACPLSLFALGTLSGVIAGCFLYILHRFGMASIESDSAGLRRAAATINLVAILFVAGSVICFACGCWTTYQVFKSGVMGPPTT